MSSKRAVSVKCIWCGKRARRVYEPERCACYEVCGCSMYGRCSCGGHMQDLETFRRWKAFDQLQAANNP